MLNIDPSGDGETNKIAALTNALQEMDFDTEDLIRVVTALGSIKKKAKEPEKKQEEEKVVLDKTLVLGKDDCYIFRDNRTKRKGWYIRIYD